MTEPPVSPLSRATYRLQFHKAFGFDEAARLAPYLARLGVSHVYASPYLMARPGSTHGYDIVDHDKLNPELGGDAAFARLVAALKKNGLGQIMDFVPNHMGVGGSDNPLWLDVLEWGRDSDHAGWFDIDWEPDSRYLHNKLLVPFLGDQYGLELERGHLRLKCDFDAGSFAVWAYDVHKLPICPLHYDRILGTRDPDLERLGDTFAGLPGWRPQIGRRADELKAEIATLVREEPKVRTAIETAVERFNGGDGRFRQLAAPACADPGSALAARAFPRSRRRHQLSPLLQHQRPRRPAHGTARGVRPHSPACLPPAGRGNRGRVAH